MKLTIERGALLKSLGHVQNVVERRNTIPILSNVLLEAGSNTLGLTATDMDLTIVERVPVSVGSNGAATVPAHTLYDIVRKLPEGAQVEIDGGGEGGQATVRAGRSKFSLPTLPREDFPATAGGDLPHRFTVPAAALRGLIDRSRFAISTEETRYYLNGIYLHVAEAKAAEDKHAEAKAGEGKGAEGKPGGLRAVATDGHRLARVEMALPEGAVGMPGVIVPRKTVGELRKLIEESEEPVEISLSDTRIRFTFDSVTLSSKLIDGNFPDYQRVIPTGNDKSMIVFRRDFAEAVDRVSTIASEKSRAIKLSLKKGNMVLSASSPENGSASEELEIRYDGPTIEIGFNARYLLDITAQLQGDEAEFKLADAASPTLLGDPADPSALYVLMPMRV
jgi:DNA polymerase III subunit beta